MADEQDRGPYDDADPDAALRRLESMGRGDAAGGKKRRAEREPAAPESDAGAARQQSPAQGRPPAPEEQAPSPREPAEARDARPLPSSHRPRPALAPDRPARVMRLVAPAVFLAAVLVVFGLAWRSGVVGEGPAPAASPSPEATAKSSPTAEATPEKETTGGTRTYTVKAGDTLSGIAERFDTTVTTIEDLNTDQDLSTLTPGQKLTVPVP